jgi:8-oxo-dGTP diphosphatase
MRVVNAVSGLLQRKDKILIAERPAGKPYSGYWEFPGGKIEENESGEQALIRELHEELGITVNAATFLFQHEYTYPDKIVHLQLWLVNDFSGEPHGLENQTLAWVDLSEIKNYRLLDGNWSLVEKLDL